MDRPIAIKSCFRRGYASKQHRRRAANREDASGAVVTLHFPPGAAMLQQKSLLCPDLLLFKPCRVPHRY